MNEHAKPPFPAQQQPMPGRTGQMRPRPDHGENSYRGSGKLNGKKAIITGGDSGIGRAVALAYAREGADILIAYLSEDADAKTTAELVEAEGRTCELMAGDLCDANHCKAVIDRAVEKLGGIDILVNNAAFQMAHEDIADISPDELDRTFRTNVYAPFLLTQSAVVHMPPGSAIVNTVSINSDKPNASLVAYAATKGALQNLTGGLAQALAGKGIRVNCVAPGPIWTPLIPSTMPADKVREFGGQVPLKRPGQPAELAPAYVYLASDESSYTSGATIAVTGGAPFM